MTPFFKVYHCFLRELGPQGWWPVTGKGEGKPTYHKRDYSYPRSEDQRLEICLGAILTQNTNWKNAEKALAHLQKAKISDVDSLLKIKNDRLGKLIRSSGYYNQKALKLKNFAAVVNAHGGIKNFLKKIPRGELLKIKGIGPETADSILLYAGKRPFFVVDAYTRRLFGGKFFSMDAPYEEIRKIFEKNLPKDWRIYNEFHALIVEKGRKR